MDIKERLSQIQAGEIQVDLVQENKLFESLSQKEKLSIARDAKHHRPEINIWRNTWVYIEELDQWVLVHQTNTFDARYTWSPDYVSLTQGDNQYILRIDDMTLFSKVLSHTTNT